MADPSLDAIFSDPYYSQRSGGTGAGSARSGDRDDSESLSLSDSRQVAWSSC